MDIGYYTDCRTLLDNRTMAVVRYLFTYGLCVGIDPMGSHHQTRYCYPDEASALRALEIWDGVGDPPGPWIKQKPEDRSNPLLNP